jgi:hypothetical protein
MKKNVSQCWLVTFHLWELLIKLFWINFNYCTFVIGYKYVRDLPILVHTFANHIFEMSIIMNMKQILFHWKLFVLEVCPPVGITQFWQQFWSKIEDFPLPSFLGHLTTAADIFVWVYVRNQVHRPTSTTTESSRNMGRAIVKVSAEIPIRVFLGTVVQIRFVRLMRGHHMEYFWTFTKKVCSLLIQ